MNFVHEILACVCHCPFSKWLLHIVVSSKWSGHKAMVTTRNTHTSTACSTWTLNNRLPPATVQVMVAKGTSLDQAIHFYLCCHGNQLLLAFVAMVTNLLVSICPVHTEDQWSALYIRWTSDAGGGRVRTGRVESNHTNSTTAKSRGDHCRDVCL